MWYQGCLDKVPKLKQNIRKNEAVTGKTLFFVWKCCVFNLSTFNEKIVLQFFEKDLHFSENLFKSYYCFKIYFLNYMIKGALSGLRQFLAIEAL